MLLTPTWVSYAPQAELTCRTGSSVPMGGPQLIVTDKAVFDFDDGSREMGLGSLHPGVTQDAV